MNFIKKALAVLTLSVLTFIPIGYVAATGWGAGGSYPGTTDGLNVGALTALFCRLTGCTMSGDLDMDGNDIILDTDGDTKIVNGVDDTFDLELAGASEFAITAGSIASTTALNVTSPSTFTITGTGGSNNEDLAFDLETTADTVGISSSTSVSLWDFGAIGLAGGSLDCSDGNITNVGDIAIDSFSPDSTNVSALMGAAGTFINQTDSSATNTIIKPWTLRHQTDGAAASGFGSGISFQLESDGGSLQYSSHINSYWIDASNGAEHGGLCIQTADIGDDGLADRLCIDEDGDIALATGNMTFTGGGTIDTTSNGNLLLAPNGTGTVDVNDALLQVGDGTYSWGQSPAGIGVEGVSEFDARVHFDDGMEVTGTAGGVGIAIEVSGNKYARIHPYTDDGLHFSVNDLNNHSNNHIIFTEESNTGKNHDLSTQATNLQIYLFSNYDVDTDNTRWGRFEHTGGAAAGEFLISTGSGDIKLSPASNRIVADTIVNHTPSGVQSLAAGTTITILKGIAKIAGSGGAVTITSTPSLTAGTDGDIIRILGTDDTNTVTLQDDDNAAGTALELDGNVDFTMGINDTLTLLYNGTTSKWVELSRSDNN